MTPALPPDATWVRFPRFVGDAVMQLSVLRLLRRLGVGPLVAWGPASTVSLVEDHELADAVVLESGKPGVLAMARTLREHRATRSIHFPKSLRPALAAWLARVPERIGVDESLQGPFNTHSGPFRKAGGHFLDRYAAVLRRRWPEAPDPPFADYDPGLPIDAPATPHLCLMPGSAWPSKAWPGAHWRTLALRARREGFAVVVLGSAGEAELGGRVAGKEGLNLCGRTSLREAAAWLRAARGAVGNDSGLSHLAAACGTPTLSLFGPTPWEASGPRGPKVRALRRDGVPCAPCGSRTCFTEGHPCLEGIAPDEAWGALEALLI